MYTVKQVNDLLSFFQLCYVQRFTSTKEEMLESLAKRFPDLDPEIDRHFAWLIENMEE